eukprot:1148472-Pelagomonas_calceolata.AAC.3
MKRLLSIKLTFWLRKDPQSTPAKNSCRFKSCRSDAPTYMQKRWARQAEWKGPLRDVQGDIGIAACLTWKIPHLTACLAFAKDNPI